MTPRPAQRPDPSARQHRRSRTTMSVIVAATAASLLAGGCGGSDSKPSAAKRATTTVPAPTTTAVATTTSIKGPTTTWPVVPGMDATKLHIIWQAYLDSLNAQLRAFGNPGGDLTFLSSFFAGEMLTFMQDESAKRAQEGVIVELPPGSKSSATLRGAYQASPTEVVLQTCRLDDAIRKVAATGEVTNDKVSLTTGLEGMELKDGRWRSASFQRTPATPDQCPEFS